MLLHHDANGDSIHEPMALETSYDVFPEDYYSAHPASNTLGAQMGIFSQTQTNHGRDVQLLVNNYCRSYYHQNAFDQDVCHNYHHSYCLMCIYLGHKAVALRAKWCICG